MGMSKVYERNDGEIAMKRLNIFIASGNDLKTERDQVLQVNQRLRKAFPQLDLNIVTWESDLPSGSYDKICIQEEINPLLDSANIVLVVFFSRLGKFTFEEYRMARQKNKKVFLYFRTGFAPKNTREIKAYGEITRLRREIHEENQLHPREFGTLKEFDQLLYEDLNLYLSQTFPSFKTKIDSQDHTLEMLYYGSKGNYTAFFGKNGRFRNVRVAELILPAVEIRKKDTAVRKFEGVAAALQYTWTCDWKHTVITGEAGSGKTVSMLDYWKRSTRADSVGEDNSIPLYVDLKEYNQVKEEKRSEFILTMIHEYYGNESFTREELWNTMKKPLKASRSTPALILFLDGFNEINAPTGKLLRGINRVVEQWPGVQVVIGSRDDMRAGFNWNNWNLLELAALEDRRVKECLEGSGFKIPREKLMNNLLENPMNLALFTGINKPGELPKTIEPAVKTHVLWTFAHYAGKKKEFQKAHEYALGAFNADKRENPEVLYRMGVYTALAGDQSSAVDLIKQSIKAGKPAEFYLKGETWDNRKHLERDISDFIGWIRPGGSAKIQKEMDSFKKLVIKVGELEQARGEETTGDHAARITEGYGKLKEPSHYINYYSIKNWFTLKYLKNQYQEVLTGYTSSKEKEQKCGELSSEISRTKKKSTLWNVLMILFGVLTFASYIMVVVSSAEYVFPNKISRFGFIGDIIWIALVILWGFISWAYITIEIFFRLFSDFSALGDIRFLWGYATILLFSISIYGKFSYDEFSKETSGFREQLKEGTGAIEAKKREIYSIKCDIDRTLENIRWKREQK